MATKDMGVWFGMLSQSEKEAVIREVGLEAAELFEVKKKAIQEAVGLKELRGADRLQAYVNRAPEVWGELQQFSPEEYRNQMRDFDRLQRRVSFSSPPSAREFTGPTAQRNAAESAPAYEPGVF